MPKRCSIIIRTRNEERWIGSCLTAVFQQTDRDFEVILVDNESTDRTVAKARSFPITRLATCHNYLPGKALNLGIRQSSGRYIVCLSGHCIPASPNWLERLVATLEGDPKLAGVYGRQEPMAFSSLSDKRDLLLVFGLDRRTQIKDSFFHNANSIIRRELWERVPFDETLTNIEDRAWAQRMLELGYRLCYEPEASVYHHHGIHQNNDQQRCSNVVRMLEQIHNGSQGGALAAGELNIVTIIPVKGPGLVINGKPAVSYTVQAALESNYAAHVFVATDDLRIADVVQAMGAEEPILRPASLSEDYIGLEAVYRFALEQIEARGVYPDLLVMLEPTFPFRPRQLIDAVVVQTLRQGLDTVIAARRESGSLWKETEVNGFSRLDSGFVPRQFKERSFVGLKGLCCVTHPEFVREERLLGDHVGLFEVDNPLVSIEIRETRDLPLAERMLDVWLSVPQLQTICPTAKEKDGPL